MRGRWAYPAVFAGACAQLTGTAVDAVIHRMEPGRAATEAPLSLANPGHLLFFVGTALIVSGVAWASVVARGGRVWAGVPVPAALLLGLSATTGVIVLASGGTTGHDHRTAGPRLAAVDRVLLAHLDGVMQADGLRAALDRFDDMSRRDHRLYRRSHFVVHELGRLAYAHYGGSGPAFRRCDRRFDGGCYHGVLQAYFARTRALPAGGLGPFCDAVAGAPGHALLRFECVHGLGHGLFSLTGGRTARALGHCDGLPTRVDRSHCYGGVFMEQVVSRLGHHGRASSHAPTSLEACGAIRVRYRWQCYGSQAFAGLLTNGHDFRAAFRRCERAPAPYDAACDEGMGGVIEGYTAVTTRKGAGQAQALCMLARARLRGACFNGLARNALAADWSAAGALGLCRRAPAPAARGCFEQVGWVVPELGRGSRGSAVACRAAGRATWIRLCARGARLRRSSQAGESDVVAFSGQAPWRRSRPARRSG